MISNSSFAGLRRGLLQIIVAAAVAAALLVPSFATSAMAGAKAPFPIFDDNGTGKRDQLQHLLFLAEHANTHVTRGKQFRLLASTLIKAGRKKEAMRAYEAAALEGDPPSATAIIDALEANRYKPHDLAMLVKVAILPRAQTGGVNGCLLMATLLSTGRIKGASFETAGFWLNKAAGLGSGSAQRMLAESAERRGDITTAARLYAQFDKTGTHLPRALRQAKAFYLGTHVKQNTDIALAWLKYAAGIDAVAAGRVAAHLIRDLPDGPAQDELLAYAAAGGVSNPAGRQSPSTRLAEATTREERHTVLEALKAEANGGNASAAIVVWHAMVEDGAPQDETAPYLALAAKSGSQSAIGVVIKTLVRETASTPESDALLAVVDAVARAGNIDALKALGSLYAAGGPVAPDQSKSLEYFKLAADDGDLEFKIRVGIYLAQNPADEAGLELARQYLAAAAAQGSASAQAFLDALPA